MYNVTLDINQLQVVSGLHYLLNNLNGNRWVLMNMESQGECLLISKCCGVVEYVRDNVSNAGHRENKPGSPCLGLFSR